MMKIWIVLFSLVSASLVGESFPTEPLPEALLPKPKTYTFSVILEPLHLTTIFSEVNTPVLKIYKRMGESFEKDELIMDLDKRVYESNNEKAKASVVKFTTELEAKKRLFTDDALSQFELDDTVAALAGAEADLAISTKLLNSTSVKGPYHGRVVKVFIKEYELAQQNKELVTLVDDSFLFAKFLVPSSLLRCLKLGMPVDIIIKETGTKIASSITRIAPVIDPSSATIMVEAKIDNTDGSLLSGMSGRVVFKECE